jgi:hypothetical protein
VHIACTLHDYRVLTSPASSVTERPAVDPRLALCLTAVYLIWGSTYLAMRIAVEELPPFLMASLRFSAADSSCC